MLAVHRFDSSGLRLGALIYGLFQLGEKGEKYDYVIQIAL